MLWSHVGLKFILVATVLFCRFYRPPRPPSLLGNLVHAAILLTVLWTYRRFLAEGLVVGLFRTSHLRMDVLYQYADMFLVIAASFWLLYRSLQTLRLPVQDLIEILKVDVPECPDVSLANIRSNAATLEWTRPPSSRPVQKYVIQVNGINVGTSEPQDSAITVTGLKPGHYYNIRVIAVGSNNFQAGSPVVRLRTYGKDSRPQLGNGRLPPSFVDQNQSRRKDDDHEDEGEAPRSLVPSIEAALAVDGSTSRDAGLTTVSHRRNTINRRHSPSLASMDQPVIKDKDKEVGGAESQESLAELDERFQRIRKDIGDAVSQYEREEADFKLQEEEMRKELDRKRGVLKEKETNTKQLQKQVTVTGEQMRAVEKEKSKKKGLLEDKKAKLANSQQHVAKLEAEIKSWRERRDEFETKKTELDEFRSSRVTALDEENGELQDECSKLEAELKEKGKKLKELKAERQKLPGGEADERWKLTDIQLRKDWDARKKELEQRVFAELRRGQQLTGALKNMHGFIDQLREQPSHANLNLFLQQGANASAEFDQLSSSQAHLKRHSRQSNSFSMWPTPVSHHAHPDALYATSGAGSRSGFPAGPFMNMSTTDAFGHNQAFSSAEPNPLSIAAPLSPTATSLVPRYILGDDLDDPPSPSSKSGRSPFRAAPANLDGDPQSPASSSRSLSMLSSPHSSSQHLPFPQYSGESADPRSRDLGIGSSPTTGPSQPSRFGSLLSGFQRTRGVSKGGGDDLGPPLGSLKPGQSQSFPRQTDDTDALGNKRRISFGTNLFNRNSVHADTGDVHVTTGSRPFSTRRFNPFASSHSSGIPMMTERSPSSPRPSSIASSDLARPSTDSGSIWGVPGDPSLGKNRIWSPSDARWASRGPSRRPSLHGQSTAPETTLASADDEILDEEALLNPQVSPSQVGVIGSRVPTSRSLSQRLNPKAPAFMGGIFRKQEKADARAKGREKGKDRALAGNAVPSVETSQALSMDDSPSDSRKSRDTFSVHTQTSVSESRESLNLDSTLSNTPSEANMAGSVSGSAANLKDQEGGLKKLFRKGSSSRFSLSSRLKKGPGSTTNSDKNFSADRSSVGDDDIGDDCRVTGGYDSVTSSPLLGPTKAKDKEGRMSSWRFSMKKKGRDPKGSLELDRERHLTTESETGDEKS